MKLLFSILALLISGNTFSQWGFSSPGRVKISLVKFFCNKETLDDAFDADGKKDEIFFSFMYTVAGISGNTKLSSKTATGVFGDASGPFGNRTSAGSATDIFGNNRGGIRTNDIVACNIPILDVALDAGDVISLVPSVWEWDNNNFNVQQNVEGGIMAAFPQMNTKIVEYVKYCFPTTDDQGCFVRNGTGYLGMPDCSGFLQSVSNKPGNRPIGMTVAGGYSPVVISMGAELLEKVSAMQFHNVDGEPGHTNIGNLPVSFNEEALGNTRDHGRYGMYLKVEFIKTAAAQVPSPSPAPSPKYSKVPPVVKLQDKINQTSITNILGKWAGIQTNDYGLYPQNIVFELTGNGEYLIKDVNGTLAAKGNYGFSNNILSGSYKQFSSNETFSFSAIFDPATQKLSGTLGNRTATTGQGKWNATRK